MDVAVSAVIVSYESGPTLLRCLESLERGNEGTLQVIVVNNGTIGAEIRAAGEMDLVEVVSPGANIGFAAGCNLGAEYARGDVVVFLNPDTLVAPGALAALARTLADRSIGVAMPRLRLLDEPALLNSSGNVVHITGLAWAGGYRVPAEEVSALRDVPFASGSALAIRRDLFRKLGGFTPELFMYQEDLELAWRVRMRGLRVVLDPRADVYHDYEFARNEQKLYFLERNRLVFLLTAFSSRLIFLLAPVLLCTEIALVLRARKQAWLGDKVAGWAWCARNAAWLGRRRREIQSGRRVPDRELAKLLTPVIDPAMTSVPPAVRALNPLLSCYWSLARKAL